MIDYNVFNNELDESLEILDIAGSLENVGFTKEQVRFINLLIVRALEKYDKLSAPEPK